MGKNLIILLFLSFWINLSGQQGSSEIEIDRKLSDYSESLNPQKIFIHFDKDRYYSGENIWFKIYLVNAITHLPDTSSSNLWVELVNSQGEIVDIKLFSPQDGFAWGAFSLYDSLPDGNYFIRSYTDWMRNLGTDFYFTKFFYIKNSSFDNLISKSDIRINKRFNKLLDKNREKIIMTFFPEGGTLVAGINNRVAFKATDAIGSGINISGFLMDSKKKVIIPEIHSQFSGMGYFDFEPLLGETYTFVPISEKRTKTVYQLDKAASDGFSLRIDTRDDSLVIAIRTNIPLDSKLFPDSLVILAHTRGVIYYGETVDFSEGCIRLALSKRIFPSGITHFTVFLPNYTPVAERLVFIDQKDQLFLSSNILNDFDDNQQNLIVLFNAIHPFKGPMSGSFSIAVQNVSDSYQDNQDNIISYLLVNSDLVGFSEKFSDLFVTNERNGERLDLLMMTHGWRRFSLNKVLSGIIPKLEFEKNFGISIVGKVVNPANNKPVINHPVQLRVLSGHNEVFNQRTNKDGIFAFNDLKYSDLVKIEIMAARLSGGVLPFVFIEPNSEADIDYVMNPFTEKHNIIKPGASWQKPTRSAVVYNTASQDDKSSIYGTPDQIVYVDERLFYYASIIDILRERVTGFSIVQGQIRLRGTSSFYGSSEPVLFIDGSQIDSRAFSLINPKDVHKIEVFKGASAALFGMRGANGAILVSTKRHANMSTKEYYDFLVLGFHTPREFYNDIVQSLSNQSGGINPIQTLFWEPNLTTDANGKARYYIPIVKGVRSYRVVIQGLGKNGGLGFQEFFINIEE